MSRLKLVSAAALFMAVVLGAGAWAWACVAVSSIELTPGQAAPGATVQGKGTGFSGDPTYSDVEVRLGGKDGPVMAKTKPLPSSGNVSFSFTVPSGLNPGTYTVLATQYDEGGAPAWGTPARATLTVPGAAVGTAPKNGTPEQETIGVRQQHVVIGDVGGRQQAAAAPAPILSIEEQDRINEHVGPGTARTASFSPIGEPGSSDVPARAGLALVAVGFMALLTAASAALVIRSTNAATLGRRIR